MEPQLIDYYNEMPSGVNVIDKMNEELTVLQKKHDELEKKNPKLQILFNSIEEFNQKHEEMYSEIQNTCDCYFDDFEYTYMRISGITPRQSAHLTFAIERELNKITHDENFSHINAYKIMKPITKIFRGGETPHWAKIYDSLTKDELKDIFFNNIKNYIEEDTRDKYAIFKCHQCGKIDDYVTDENKCVDCYDPGTDEESVE
tara:strand:- start:85 stop:690 length:606 start_codon:yes stop_codon:yes gene_type:complete